MSEDSKINDAIYDLVEKIIKMSRQEFSPFPYAGCFKLIELDKDHLNDLIPDLDNYFYTIYSHSNGVKKVISWPRGRLLSSLHLLEKDFFSQYPKYHHLIKIINNVNTPDLSARLVMFEQMRNNLLHLLNLLLKRSENLDR